MNNYNEQYYEKTLVCILYLGLFFKGFRQSFNLKIKRERQRKTTATTATREWFTSKRLGNPQNNYLFKLPLRRGRGVKAVPLRKKEPLGEIPTSIKLEGGGVKALMTMPIKKKNFFLRLPLMKGSGGKYIKSKYESWNNKQERPDEHDDLNQGERKILTKTH